MKSPHIVLLTLILSCSSSAIAKHRAPVSDDLQATYRHFVGTWTGTDTHLKNGVWVKEPVRVVISESPKSPSLRLDYEYGKKGTKGFHRATRFIVFEPEDERVIFHWLHESKEEYRSEGLEDFVRSGYGSFSITNVVPVVVDASGKRGMYKCELQLTQSSFRYTWLQSSEESNFEPYGLFEFARQESAPQSGNSVK